MTKIVKNIPLMDLMSYLIESVDSPTHVGMVQVFEPVNEPCSEVVQRVLRGYREGEVGPPFNYYPVFPRFGMPKWAEAEQFDSSYHIRHAAIPAPGTEPQLIEMIMDLHATMLDRSRPGWIAYVIEGLENDCFAIYWKVQHAYIDGASAVLRLDAAMSKTADDLEVRPLWGPLFEPSRVAEDRSIAELLEGSREILGLQSRAMGDVARSIGRSMLQAGGMLEREAPLPFSAPKTVFNKPVRAIRQLGVGAAGLDRFKAIALQEKASINEVALAMVGAALERYSEKHSQAPDKPLIAACPMAVRAEGDTDASTQIAAISIKLGQPGTDIRTRLEQIRVSSQDAKEEARNMSREALMNYLVLMGGTADLLSKSPLADYVPPLASVNVSNVAGPRYRCYLSGAEMVRSYPVSTLAGGTAINITFTSVSGRMDYAVITDARSIPGAQEIADFMAEALNELEAVSAPRAKAGTASKTKARKKSRPKSKARTS